MEILKSITDGCDSLTARRTIRGRSSPAYSDCASDHHVGLVWRTRGTGIFARRAPGFNMAKFLNFFMLITFAYCFVKFYDSAIPGIGFSLQGFVRGGTNNLVQIIGTDTTTHMLGSIKASLSRLLVPASVHDDRPVPDSGLLLHADSSRHSLSADIIIIAYGAVGATVVGILGPVFIPFMVFEKTDFLFWGWLKAYLSFSFYKVVAAATMSILGQLYARYYTNLVDFTHPINLMKNFPLLIILVMVNLFMLLKIPAMTATIFSGHTGGHDRWASSARC